EEDAGSRADGVSRPELDAAQRRIPRGDVGRGANGEDVDRQTFQRRRDAQLRAAVRDEDDDPAARVDRRPKAGGPLELQRSVEVRGSPAADPKVESTLS